MRLRIFLLSIAIILGVIFIINTGNENTENINLEKNEGTTNTDYENWSDSALFAQGMQYLSTYDKKLGIHLLTLASEKGNIKSSLILGKYYLEKITKKNDLYFTRINSKTNSDTTDFFNKAFLYLTKSKEIDEAKFELANIYFSLANKQYEYEEIYNRYKEIHNDSVKPKSNYMLGYMKYHGLGTKKDLDSARFYFKQTEYSKYVEYENYSIFLYERGTMRAGPYRTNFESMGLGPSQYYIAMSFLKEKNSSNIDSAIKYLIMCPLRPICSYMTGTLLYEIKRKQEALYYLTLAKETKIKKSQNNEAYYYLTSPIDNKYIELSNQFLKENDFKN